MGTDKRSRLTVAELLVTAAIVAVLVPLPGSRAAGPAVRSDQLPPQTQKKTPPPYLCARVLPRFDVRDQDLPTVVARLSGEHHVPCGLALVPDRSQTAAEPPQPPFERLYTLFEETHVACIITTLTDIDRAFVSGTTDDFATIGVPGTFSSENHPLQTVIPEFTARNVPWPIALFGGPEPTDAVAPAPLFRSKALPPDFRVTMDTTGRAWSDYPTITYTTTNRKLLDVINDIARELGLSWRLLDRSLLGGSGVDFFMGAELPTAPDLAAPLPVSDPTAPLGRPPAIATGEAAVARALRFFQDVGWEPDRGGQYPKPEPIAAFPVRRHGADCWEVTLNNLSAEVSPGTGIVVGCQKRRLFRDTAEDSPTIEQATANQLALSYLSAGGVQLDDAIIWKSELTRDRDAWYVYLRREHNGFVFQDHDWDLVILEPEDGSLRGYGHNFRSPLRESTEALITDE